MDGKKVRLYIDKYVIEVPADDEQALEKVYTELVTAIDQISDVLDEARWGQPDAD